MAKILFDFECQVCSQVFEEFYNTTAPDENPAKCVCGSTTTKRLIGATRIDPKLGLDPEGFPTMGDKWARIRNQRTRIERQQASAHGEC